MPPTDTVANVDDAAVSDEATTTAESAAAESTGTEGEPPAGDGRPAPDGERTILGVEYELAGALACAGIGASAVAAIPVFGTDMRTATMLVALGLFGMTGALGSLAVYAVE